MEKKFTMVIGGDFVPSESNEARLVAGDLESTFGDVAEIFKKADFSFINVECALTKRGTAIEKCGPNLRADPDCLLTLKKLGIGLLGFANNHSLDWGKEGMQDSIAAAEKYGIPYVGCGMNIQEARRPYYIEKNGIRVCFINVAENECTIASLTRAGANPFDPYDTMDDIRAAKKDGYKVIVVYHGGKEMYDVTSPNTRRRLRKMVEYGADFVFAQHTHCVCCHEEYMGGQICYGQGNTLFELNDFINHPMWKCGILPVITITETKNKVEYVPFLAENGGIRLAKGVDAANILVPFGNRSKILYDEEEFQKRWLEFILPVGKSYLSFITDVDENGNTLDPHKMSSVANEVRCEIHNEMLQACAHYHLVQSFGKLKVDGQE